MRNVALYAAFRHHRIGTSDCLSGHLLLSKILNGISDVSLIRSVDLGACRLDSLPVSTVVNLNFLCEVSLDGTFVTMHQARALMMNIAKGSQILKLHLGKECMICLETLSDALDNLEPTLVAEALNKVEYLCYNKISCTDGGCRKMEPDVHFSAFLEEMGKKTNLRQIKMERNAYFNVSSEVVAKAFNNLENLEFANDSCISTKQIVALFKLMSKETKIVRLTLSCDDVLLLNSELVARAVVKVIQADVTCKVSRAHVRALLSQVNYSAKIKRLNLGSNDISKIPERVVENAAEVLRKNGGSVTFKSDNEKKFMSY